MVTSFDGSEMERGDSSKDQEMRDDIDGSTQPPSRPCSVCSHSSSRFSSDGTTRHPPQPSISKKSHPLVSLTFLLTLVHHKKTKTTSWRGSCKSRQIFRGHQQSSHILISNSYLIISMVKVSEFNIHNGRHTMANFNIDTWNHSTSFLCSIPSFFGY